MLPYAPVHHLLFDGLVTRAPTASVGVLALAGDLKGAVCLAQGDRAWLSQHLGDLAELATYQAVRRAVDQLVSLTRIRPHVVAVDAHPGYLSARLGRELAAEWGVPVVAVQHHHAHVVSLLAESQQPFAEPVIGVAFDGTGYGPDGAIWGGDFLVVTTSIAERVAHLKDVPLPGGDAAIEHPARTALAQLRASHLAWDGAIPSVAALPAADRAVLLTQLDRGVVTVATSSMGRLFDAVASLCGVRHTVSYEAQAAIELEAIADPTAVGAYAFCVADANGVIDCSPVIRAVVSDVLAGIEPSTISMRFHRAVISLVLDTAKAMASTIALGRMSTCALRCPDERSSWSSAAANRWRSWTSTAPHARS